MALLRTLRSLADDLMVVPGVDHRLLHGGAGLIAEWADDHDALTSDGPALRDRTEGLTDRVSLQPLAAIRDARGSPFSLAATVQQIAEADGCHIRTRWV